MPVSRPPLPLSAEPVLAGRATRRSALLAGSALALLAGCRWGPDEDADPSDPSTSEPVDQDAEIVAAAVAATSEVLALLEATARDHIGLATALSALSDAHRAHLDLIGPESAEGTAASVSGSARAAVAGVRRAEQSLQRELADLAVEAASGPLARVLASMSASIGQHVAGLPELGRGPA